MARDSTIASSGLHHHSRRCWCCVEPPQPRPTNKWLYSTVAPAGFSHRFSRRTWGTSREHAVVLRMPQLITEYPQFFTAANLEWKKALHKDEFKEVIIRSFRFLGWKYANHPVRVCHYGQPHSHRLANAGLPNKRTSTKRLSEIHVPENKRSHGLKRTRVFGRIFC